MSKTSKKTSKNPKNTVAEEPYFENNGVKSLEIVIDNTRSHVAGMPNNTSRYFFVARKQTSDQPMQEDEEDDDPTARTVVVTGIPLFYNEQDVKEVFEMFGTVEVVFFRVNGGADGRVAEIVMEDEEDVEKIFATKNAKSYVSGTGVVGLEKYKADYLKLRPNYDVLQTQVDMFMAAFDERTESEKAALRAKVAQKDEDGFQYVTYKLGKKKRGLDSVKDSTRRYNKRMAEKQNTVFSFYKYQEQEKQMEKLAALRKKFDEDKQRMAEIKNSRKFKPF